MPDPPPDEARAAPPLAVFALSLVLLSACAGSGSTAATPGATTRSSTQPASAAAYIACLQRHGYTPPAGLIRRLGSPSTNAANPTASSLEAPSSPTTATAAQDQIRRQARQACRSEAPAGLRGAGPNGGQFFSAVRAYISCLNDHGYTKIPVPTTAPAGPSGRAGFDLAAQLRSLGSDPAAAAAMAACQALRPGGINRPATTTTAAA